jgi:hypothetical protein
MVTPNHPGVPRSSFSNGSSLCSELHRILANICKIPEDDHEKIQRSRVMDEVVAIRRAMDQMAQPKPAEGGAVVGWITDNPVVCNSGFTRDPAIAREWHRQGWLVTALAPASSGAVEHERDMLANAIRDAAVKAGICRDDVSLTGPHLLMLCDDLATAAPAGSGEAVAIKVGRDLAWTPYGMDAGLLDRTKLYAGAPPADAEALIEDVNDIIALGRVLRQGEPDPIDLQELSDALSEAVRIAERIDGRLSGGEGL